MNEIYLPISVLLVIVVFYRVRMRLDPPMIIISIAFPLSFFFRLPLSFLNTGGMGQNHFTAIANLIIFSLKALAYGITIPIIASQAGLAAFGGSEGVGTATTMAVVNASLAVTILDFVLSGVGYIFFFS